MIVGDKMKYIYKPIGVCSTKMEFEIENDIVKNLIVEGGCSGNAAGISRLVENEPIDRIIERLEGIPCGRKSTSCPDQIATALKIYKEKRNM